jgi:hypothetical protein
MLRTAHSFLITGGYLFLAVRPRRHLLVYVDPNLYGSFHSHALQTRDT